MAGGGLPHPQFIVPAALDAIGIHGIPVHVQYTWVVMIMLFVLGFLVRRNIQEVPGKLQNFFELIIGGLEDFTVANIGEKGREVYHVIIILFLFILPCNWFGLVPGLDAPRRTSTPTPPWPSSCSSTTTGSD